MNKQEHYIKNLEYVGKYQLRTLERRIAVKNKYIRFVPVREITTGREYIFDLFSGTVRRAALCFFSDRAGKFIIVLWFFNKRRLSTVYSSQTGANLLENAI